MDTYNWLDYIDLLPFSCSTGHSVRLSPLLSSTNVTMKTVAIAILIASREVHLSPSALLQRLSLYAVGSIVLRSAACVLNDICDLDIDRQVGEFLAQSMPYL